jgi:hypothetical protein
MVFYIDFTNNSGRVVRPQFALSKSYNPNSILEFGNAGGIAPGQKITFLIDAGSQGPFLANVIVDCDGGNACQNITFTAFSNNPNSIPWKGVTALYATKPATLTLTNTADSTQTVTASMTYTYFASPSAYIWGPAVPYGPASAKASSTYPNQNPVWTDCFLEQTGLQDESGVYYSPDYTYTLTTSDNKTAASGRLPNTGERVAVGPCSIGDTYTFTMISTPNLSPSMTLNSFLPDGKQTFSTDAFTRNINADGTTYSPKFTGGVVEKTNNRIMVSSYLEGSSPITVVNSGVSPKNIPLPPGQIDSGWSSDLGNMYVTATKVSGLDSSPDTIGFSGVTNAEARIGVNDVYTLALPNGDVMTISSFDKKALKPSGMYGVTVTPHYYVSAAAPDFVAIKFTLESFFSPAQRRPPSSSDGPVKFTKYACKNGFCMPSSTGTFFDKRCNGVCPITPVPPSSKPKPSVPPSPSVPKKGLSLTLIIIIAVAAVILIGVAAYGVKRYRQNQNAPVASVPASTRAKP